MSKAHKLLWNFLPGQQEADSFAYLDDVRLALREIRLAGVRPIASLPDADVVLERWDSIIKTYSIPLTTLTRPVLSKCARTWLRGGVGRSLRIKAEHAEIETQALHDIDQAMEAALAGAG